MAFLSARRGIGHAASSLNETPLLGPMLLAVRALDSGYRCLDRGNTLDMPGGRLQSRCFHSPLGRAMGRVPCTTLLLLAPAFSVPKLPQKLHRPLQSLGQSYLQDPNTVKKISLSFAERVEPNAPVLELGPGLGALTQSLSETFPKMRAVEIDERAVSRLQRDLPDTTIYLQELRWRLNIVKRAHLCDVMRRLSLKRTQTTFVSAGFRGYALCELLADGGRDGRASVCGGEPAL